MRAKRLCSLTQSGKLNVPDEIYKQWLEGNREELLLALVRSLKKHGFNSDGATRKLVRAGVPAKPKTFIGCLTG